MDAPCSSKTISNEAALQPLDTPTSRAASVASNNTVEDFLEDEMVVNMVKRSSSSLEIGEPSPLNRRIYENREYNNGQWTSAELKQMYDIIAKHGIEDGPLDLVANTTGRNLRDVWKKFEEMNVINSENNDDRMEAEINHWIKDGVKLGKGKTSKDERQVGIGNVFPWSTAVKNVNRTRPGFQADTTRKAIKKAVENLPEPRNLTNVKLNTDYNMLPKSFNKESDLNWERIYDFICRMLTGQTHAVGRLNPLEAGIILEILDDIEREANEVTDNKDECVIIRGLLANIRDKDFRDFEPDYPCTDLSAVGVYVDPLRTRKWKIPQGGSVLTDEDIRKSEEQELQNLAGSQDDTMQLDDDGGSMYSMTEFPTSNEEPSGRPFSEEDMID